MYTIDNTIAILEHNFVVYQFGKVASSSIVKSLNRLKDVSAFQTHFLGLKNFKNALIRLDSEELNDYFYSHLEGQLIFNLRINREAIKFKTRLYKDKHLHFLTVARDPVEYMRSALLQDITGYLTNFTQIWEQGDEPDHIYVSRCIGKLISLYIDFLQVTDIETMKNMAPVPNYIKSRGYSGSKQILITQIIQAMHRPLVWFNVQFCDYLDIKIEDMHSATENILYKHLGWCDCYLLKYESIETGLKETLQHTDIDQPFHFSHDNDSSTKLYAREVDSCFNSEIKGTISSLLEKTPYCQLFGY